MNYYTVFLNVPSRSINGSKLKGDIRIVDTFIMLDILVFMDILWFDWHFFYWHFHFDWQPSKSACPTSVEGEVLHILDPNSSLPMSARHARLLPLAHAHPRQVLAVLESQMEFDTGVWLCASQCIHLYCMHPLDTPSNIMDCHKCRSS